MKNQIIKKALAALADAPRSALEKLYKQIDDEQDREELKRLAAALNVKIRGGKDEK